MGRFVGGVPNHDPARLERILDERKRMIGVDVAALNAHVQERKAREAAEAAELRAFARSATQLDGFLCAAAGANEAQRRALARALDEERRRQAAERAQREAAARAAEAAACSAELAGALGSPWLNEDPRLQQSAVSPSRVRKDHFKGLSPQQVEEIRGIQAQQVAAKAQAEQAERAQQEAYDRQQAGFIEARARQAAQVEAARRQGAAQLSQELQRQVLEKQARDSGLAKLYTNPPSEGFFAQFGTSHR